MTDNTGKEQGAVVAGRFKKGESGNPKGRPKGSRNKASFIVQSMLEGEAEDIAKKLVEMAKQGEMQAIKMIIERLLPPLKELPFNSVLSLDSGNISDDYSNLLEDIAAGEITLTEAKELADILEGKRKAIETLEVKAKLDELKNLIAAGRA